MTQKTKKIFALLLLVGSINFAVVSCNKNSDNNSSGASAPPVPTAGPLIFEGGVAEALLASAPSTGPFDIPLSIQWNISGDANQIAMLRTFATSVQKSYNGPIIARGVLNIPTTLNMGYCVIPAGSYVIQPLKVGQWSYGAIQFPVLDAVSGSSHVIIAGYSNIIVDPDADGFANSIAGSFQFVQANNGTGLINCFAPSFWVK